MILFFSVAIQLAAPMDKGHSTCQNVKFAVNHDHQIETTSLQ